MKAEGLLPSRACQSSKGCRIALTTAAFPLSPAQVLVATTFISHTVGAMVILPIVQSVGDAMAGPGANHSKLLVMAAALMCSGGCGAAGPHRRRKTVTEVWGGARAVAVRAAGHGCRGPLVGRVMGQGGLVQDGEWSGGRGGAGRTGVGLN